MTGARRNWRIAAELVAMFGTLWAIDAHFAGGTAFAQVDPNPYWIPVLAMALAYGSWPGLAAAMAASLCWLIASHPPLAIGEDPFTRIVALSMPPVLWVATSAALGEVTSTRLRRLDRLARRSRKLEHNVATLVDRHASLAATNRELQVRSAIEDRSIGTAVATAVDLLDPHPAALARTIARLVAIAARSEDFTLYLTTAGVWRSFTEGADATTPAMPLPAALAAAVAGRHGAFHIGDPADRALLGDLAILALPLRGAVGEEPVGLLVFHSLDLPRLTRRTLIDFAEIADWVGVVLARTSVLDRPAQPARLRIVGSDLA